MGKGDSEKLEIKIFKCSYNSAYAAETVDALEYVGIIIGQTDQYYKMEREIRKKVRERRGGITHIFNFGIDTAVGEKYDKNIIYSAELYKPKEKPKNNLK